jgi:hypothetical protein
MVDAATVKGPKPDATVGKPKRKAEAAAAAAAGTEPQATAVVCAAAVAGPRRGAKTGKKRKATEGQPEPQQNSGKQLLPAAALTDTAAAAAAEQAAAGQGGKENLPGGEINRAAPGTTPAEAVAPAAAVVGCVEGAGARKRQVSPQAASASGSRLAAGVDASTPSRLSWLAKKLRLC